MPATISPCVVYPPWPLWLEGMDVMGGLFRLFTLRPRDSLFNSGSGVLLHIIHTLELPRLGVTPDFSLRGLLRLLHVLASLRVILLRFHVLMPKAISAMEPRP